MKINWKGITVDTWSRLILLVTIVIYLVLCGMGVKMPVDEAAEQIARFMAAVGTVWLAWKNLSLTGAAQEADAMISCIKKPTDEQLLEGCVVCDADGNEQFLNDVEQIVGDFDGT
ncbi:MAG: SPP1 phage holin family protein [Coriobacteriia bacterium]|nr:SPP1 phage holin family protein [Coriobacteriia bacterium]